MSTKDRLTVMVVDDMSVSRALIIQSLDDLGIRKVDYCVDGASAFKRLASQPVHLVISDYNMPGANGLQLLSGLRKYKTTQKIGFILITGMATEQIVDQGNELLLVQHFHLFFVEATVYIQFISKSSERTALLAFTITYMDMLIQLQV